MVGALAGGAAESQEQDALIRHCELLTHKASLIATLRSNYTKTETLNKLEELRIKYKISDSLHKHYIDITNWVYSNKDYSVDTLTELYYTKCITQGKKYNG